VTKEALRARRLGRPGLGSGTPRVTLANGIVAAVMISAIGATYWRIYYGVDFTDESYYVAVPYRLVRGANVFTDDNAVAQGFVSLMVYPFFRAYYSVAGITGIVLFARHLQFFFSLGVAAVVAYSLRAALTTSRAALAALPAVLFVPFNIHGLSYDSLGSGFFTAGCLLGFRALAGDAGAPHALGAGVCLGLAAFAYQPLLVPAVCCSVIWAMLGLPRVVVSSWRPSS
jgi:hypothetical protein